MTDDKIISPFLAGISFRCPKCGKGKIYSGLLKIVNKCSQCSFQIGKHDAADGPAYCSMSLTSVLIVILAINVELTYTPPLWLHAALWIPLIFILSIIFLRIFKSLFIAFQFKLDKDSFK